VLVVVAILGALVLAIPSKHEWAGVDEAVIGRLVTDAGREPTPMIDWVQADSDACRRSRPPVRVARRTAR
jgi:hypothetical protein